MSSVGVYAKIWGERLFLEAERQDTNRLQASFEELSLEPTQIGNSKSKTYGFPIPSKPEPVPIRIEQGEIMPRIDFYLRLRYIIQDKVHEGNPGWLEKKIYKALSFVTGLVDSGKKDAVEKAQNGLDYIASQIAELKRNTSDGTKEPLAKLDFEALGNFKKKADYVFCFIYQKYKLGCSDTVITLVLMAKICENLKVVKVPSGKCLEITPQEIYRESQFRNWNDYFSESPGYYIQDEEYEGTTRTKRSNSEYEEDSGSRNDQLIEEIRELKQLLKSPSQDVETLNEKLEEVKQLIKGLNINLSADGPEEAIGNSNPHIFKKGQYCSIDRNGPDEKLRYNYFSTDLTGVISQLNNMMEILNHLYQKDEHH